MIFAYLDQKKLEPISITEENYKLLDQAIWIDVLTPTKLEEDLLENHLNIDIPTRDEMVEIELSSRLYKENDGLFMTTSLLVQTELGPKLEPVTCIIAKNLFMTVRYTEPQSFKFFQALLKKNQIHNLNAIDFFIEFLEANIDTLADILEVIARNLEEYSKTIFLKQNLDTAPKLDYQIMLQTVGVQGESNTKARESLVTFNRLITFFSQNSTGKITSDEQVRISVLSNDISALSDYSTFVSNKVIFLLDATLGMISIEQNNIIKIFSVAAVIFLPPTLIASIYGMNFHFMPELSWKFGYPLALVLMILAAWLPYKYFKRKKWL